LVTLVIGTIIFLVSIFITNKKKDNKKIAS
jgi:hypothetical protein